MFPVFYAARLLRFTMPARTLFSQFVEGAVSNLSKPSRHRPSYPCPWLKQCSLKIGANSLNLGVDLYISIFEMSGGSFSLNICSSLYMQFGLSRWRNDILPLPHSALVAFCVSTVISRWSLYFSHRSIGTFTLPIMAPLWRNMSGLLLAWIFCRCILLALRCSTLCYLPICRGALLNRWLSCLTYYAEHFCRT